ncbi:facilitated trehalose transporter Tret1-like [Diorhabda sublineata]|uniref:facilitated trehalose transporter Tret1-like n=1 Tax=Diorhabda sublineata TaxID=1163346 RepID=UPI0024E08B35|nr:facilitated trehalose transporter Tret1-like [Diorhabda sublineata]
MTDEKKSFEENVRDNNGKDWFQILVIITGSISMLNSGLSYYWTSPFIPKIVAEKEKYNITEEQASYFAVCNLITLTIGSLFFTPIVQWLGRKKSLLLSSIPYFLCWLIKAFATNLWLLYGARLLSGLGDAIVSSHGFVYVGEVASPKIRNIWGNVPMCFMFLGQLGINVLGLYFNIQTTSYICICVLILFTITFPFMPETPYFYINRGQYEEAKITLRKLRRKQNIDEEFEQIRMSITKQQEKTSSSWIDLITVVAHRRALVAAVFLRFSQIFSGLFVFGSYTQFIFQKVGTNMSPEYSTIIYTAVNFVLYTFGAYFSSKLGRRKSLIYSLVLCGFNVLAESIFFFVESNFPDLDLSSVQLFPLLGMLLFLVFSCFGVGLVPPLMLTELFSSNIAAEGCAIVTVSFGLWSVAANSIFYYLISYTGLAGPFLLFAICNFASAIVTYYIIPETRNKTLAEIQQTLISGIN